MVGFANADGGTILIGVEDDGTVSGVGSDTRHLNELQQAAIQFTAPPVRHAIGFLPCITTDGAPDQLLVLEIPPSEQVHSTTKNEVYRRVGDQNRRLGFDEVRELTFDKGVRQFDGTPAVDVTLAEVRRNGSGYASS